MPPEMNRSSPDRWSSWRQGHCLHGWMQCPPSIEVRSYAGQLPTASALAMHNLDPLLVQSTAIKGGNVLQLFSILDEETNSIAEPEVLYTTKLSSPVSSLCWREEHLLAGCQGCVRLYNTASDTAETLSCELQETYQLTHAEEHEVMPDDWIRSSAVKAVSFSPFAATHFAALINNWVHFFDLAKDSAATSHFEVSTAPCLCMEYSSLVPHQLVASGCAGSIKVLDDRLPKKTAWEHMKAHPSPIRDIRFSPLVPHWMASVGDDSHLRVWDLRCNKTAMLSINLLQTITCQVAWAHTHTEFLAVGGADNSIKLVSLRKVPQHIVASDQQTLTSHVVGLCATRDRAEQAFIALSSSARLVTLAMTAEFLAPLVVNRHEVCPEESTDETLQMQEEEQLLYCRQLNDAFWSLKSRAEELEADGRPQAALSVIKACTALSLSDPVFEMQDGHTWEDPSQAQQQFIKELRFTSYFLPPNITYNFVDQPEVDKQLLSSVENMKLQLYLDECLAAKNGSGVFRLQDSLPKALARDPDSVDIDVLCQSIKLAREHDFRRGMDMSIEICEALVSKYNFHDFSLSVLAPTVYDGESSAETKEHALGILENLTSNLPDWIISNVKLHRDVLQAASSDNVIDLVEGFDVSPLIEENGSAMYDLASSWVEVDQVPCPATLILSQHVIRLYLESLAAKKQLGPYFLTAMHLLERVRGFEFENSIRGWVEAQLKELQRSWVRLKKRTDDADTESGIEHLAAVLPDYKDDLQLVLAIDTSLENGCSDKMFDPKAQPLPSDAGRVLAEVQKLMDAMEKSLNNCLNKLLLHPHAKASAMSLAKAMLEMVNNIVPSEQDSSLRTILKTAISMYDV